MREKYRLRVFENRVLRRILGAKKDKVTGNGENYIMRSLMICTTHPILFGRSIEKNEVGGRIILRWIIQEIGCGRIDWIDLA